MAISNMIDTGTTIVNEQSLTALCAVGRLPYGMDDGDASPLTSITASCQADYLRSASTNVARHICQGRDPQSAHKKHCEIGGRYTEPG